jgi:Ni,Fe-hydrogenase III small subunit/ferredoxin
MPWVTRGLREGIVTTRYPRRPDDYGESFRASVNVRPQEHRPSASYETDANNIADLCPTNAISIDPPGRIRLDRGRCILCGFCVSGMPDSFSFDHGIETSELSRIALVVPKDAETQGELARLRSELALRVRALRRSVHIRHVDCGSDGSEEWEIAALTNPVYDVQRLGIFFTASPRHADLLLVTGAGSTGMLRPLKTTLKSIPDPKVIVAVGADAASGGLLSRSYATCGGVGSEIRVDVFVPGSPPSPFSILQGILLAIGRLPEVQESSEKETTR